MVFDDWRNGIPVAFFIISRTREHDLYPVLQALHKRVQSIAEDWNPSAIIVDNAQAEINTLRYVMPVIIYGFLHVTHVLHVNYILHLFRVDFTYIYFHVQLGLA